ncbi:hypothetical protein GM3708_1377 [Geminocystis sp. NIES-3708]|nr:hypothetical protein GM3708_1377 [Geminocystis sp. NIES-3708]
MTLCCNFSEVKAQNQQIEDVSITGDSLQGLDSRNIEENLSKDKTPKLNITLERDNKPENKFSTGNEFIDSLISNPSNPKSSNIDSINTNKGDVPTTGSGTIPLVNF